MTKEINTAILNMMLQSIQQIDPTNPPNSQEMINNLLQIQTSQTLKA